jgi:predicted dehydrogenase
MSSAAGLGVALAAAPTRPVFAQAKAGKATPNEKIVLGFVGIAGRGNALLDQFIGHDDVEIAAIADVYKPHLDAAIDKVAKARGKAPDGYADFRKLLERADIDAIVCATPPHWHPLVTILACEAGKDVYCEKPMCMSPGEGAAMVKAARANNRITQIGTQIHATDNYHHVVDIVRSGILGKISCVHSVLCMNNAPDGIGKQADGEPPADLDWDLWCGPIPKLPFNETIFTSGRHRFCKALIGSWLHEMGPHIIDLPVWAMDMQAPKSIMAMGGKYAVDDISTVPDTMEATWEFGDHMLQWTYMGASSHGLQMNLGGKGMTGRHGTSFHGTNATLWANYDSFGVYVEGDRLKMEDLPKPPDHTWANHDREFLNSIKSRTLCACDVEYHLKVHTLLNLAHIAMNVNRKIYWDAEKRCITGDNEANALVTPQYRSPWVLPA